MIDLLRRHRVLSVFTALAIGLVLIGWWIRPISTPDDSKNPQHNSTVNVPQASSTGGYEQAVNQRHETAGTHCAETFQGQLAEFYLTVSEDRADKIIAFALQNARNTSSAAHAVMASHIVDSPEERLALLEDAIDMNPGSTHLLWTAVSACVMAKESAECPELPNWVDRLLALDGENALAWALAGHARLILGEEDEALRAFERGAISYSTNNYHVADIEAAMTAVNALGGSSEAVAYTVSVGHSAAFAQPLSHFSVCKDKVNVNEDWASACLALGKTIETTATDFLSRSLGRRMQWRSRVASGEDPETPQLEALRKWHFPSGLEEETLRYPDSPGFFINALRNHGEIKAYEMLTAMHEQRIADGYTVNCGDIRQNY